ERDRVVIRAQQQDLAVERDESIERRLPPERVIPWLIREQVLRVTSPRDEAGDVPVHTRPRIGAQELDQHAVLAARPGGLRVEGGQLLEDLCFLECGEVPA